MMLLANAKRARKKRQKEGIDLGLSSKPFTCVGKTRFTHTA